MTAALMLSAAHAADFVFCHTDGWNAVVPRELCDKIKDATQTNGVDDPVALKVAGDAYTAFEDVPYPAMGQCGPNAAPGICNQTRQIDCTAHYNWTIMIDGMLRRDGAAQTDRFIRAQAENSWSEYNRMKKLPSRSYTNT